MNAPHRHWPAITTPPAHFIANRFIASASGATLPMIDPSDGSVFAEIERGDATDIDTAMGAAMSARGGAWGRVEAADRGRVLTTLSRAIGDLGEWVTLFGAQECV